MLSGQVPTLFTTRIPPQVRDTGMRRAGPGGTDLRAGLADVHDALQKRLGTAARTFQVSAVRRVAGSGQRYRALRAGRVRR